MNRTPRLNSAFPASPRSDIRSRPSTYNARNSPSSPSDPARASPRRTSILRPVKESKFSSISNNSPIVPLDLVDAPSQRFYVVSLYIGLAAWRLYNAWHVEDDLDSTWLVLKWIGIDAAFFIALPAFRIPWMEPSFTTALTLWLLHAIANIFLMYQISIPFTAWLGAFVKIFYDREVAISEHRVKPASILHNSSIISGKQIIQILPEGSAILNPEKKAFCLDSTTTSVDLPIQINQTTPIAIELLRYDLDTDEIETIVIGGKQARQLKKQADKERQKSDTNTPRLLKYSVSKKGLYTLERVIDESKLDVRRRSHEIAVVQCPHATLSTSSSDRCRGDLSGISLQMNGVPPFRVRYSKRINQQQFSSITQNVQPPNSEDISSFTGDKSNVVLDLKAPHKGWTKSELVSVDINEALGQNGTWSYTVEEIEDGLGNRIAYDPENMKDLSQKRQVQSVTVHNRPRAYLSGCDQEHSLRVAKEDTVNLPVLIRSPSLLHSSDWPLKLSYSFSPETEDAVSALEEVTHEMSSPRSLPRIRKAGKYDLVAIDSQFCHGEVVEPSSCMLHNPPRPDLELDHEDVYDKCAGNPIGKIVNLDFTGTPPFKVRYTVTHRGSAFPKVQEFNSMRGQLEFKERSAGSYIYQILEIEDDVYGPISLKGRDLILKQDIKPPASAMFKNNNNNLIKACLRQLVTLDVKFVGEGPWDLDYEIVHGGKRKKSHAHSDKDVFSIELPEQSEGGRYSVVLTSVQDKSKCRVPLKEEQHVEVRPESPRVGFADIDGKRSILKLENKRVNLPVRLSGLAPWTVQVQHLEDNAAAAPKTQEFIFKEPNAVVPVERPGTYEIVSVHDSCPGLVDLKANKFTVSSIARPALTIKDASTEAEGAHFFRKAAVCQGDESTLGLVMSGNPPYNLNYQQKVEPLKGTLAISNKPLSLVANSALINMDTSKAGEYTYTFNALSDEKYAHDKSWFTPVTVKQKVYSPPSAKFTQAGKTYGFCKDDANLIGDSGQSSENIPITLTGEPPFAIEVAITHHGVSSRPEIIRVRDIHSNSFSWTLSRLNFELGAHSLAIRSVKDGRTCTSVVEYDPSSIRISVSSPPAIVPLESNIDFCVGDRVSFSLSGQAPFDVFYNFQNRERKARITTNEFRRIAETPGEFVITGISDSAMGSGRCRAKKEITKNIHPYPSVKISQGKTLISDIHEGGEVEMLFEFTGSPPFEFTYTRSEAPKRGRKAQILETRHDTSHEFSKKIRASDEGVYEVVSIKDQYCAYTAPNHANQKPASGQKLLQY